MKDYKNNWYSTLALHVFGIINWNDVGSVGFGKLLVMGP
jgi:hypothetical protein